MQHWLLTYGAGTRLLLWAPLVLGLGILYLIGLHLWVPATRRWVWKALLAVALPMFLVQPYLALVRRGSRHTRDRARGQIARHRFPLA